MRNVVLHAFSSELVKLAGSGRSASTLLAQRAARQGLRPSMMPAIRQVENVASKDRGRAAEIALAVRQHLKPSSKVA